MNSNEAYYQGVAMSSAMQAGAAKRSATDWQAYARSLEQKLVNAEAGLQAMRSLKDAAINELGKVDPKNYLMNQANRQKILDTAYSQKR